MRQAVDQEDRYGCQEIYSERDELVGILDDLPTVVEGVWADFRDTSYAALIAKEILWEKDSDLKLKDYLDVAQT